MVDGLDAIGLASGPGRASSRSSVTDPVDHDHPWRPTLSEPRDEREVKGELAVHTPPWLPGVSASISVRRLYDKRAVRFLEGIQLAANLSDEAFLRRIESQSELASQISQAHERIQATGSEYISDAFANLIAAAMLDDAKVDTVSYLLPRLLDLHAIHIRIICIVPPKSARIRIEIGDIAQKVGASEAVVEAALHDLRDRGLLTAPPARLTPIAEHAAELISATAYELRMRRNSASDGSN